MGQGSIRRRGEDAWELRVYQGIDPDTRRRRWLSKTVHGTERFARRRLEDLVAEAGRARIRAGTLSELLDQWLEGRFSRLVGLHGEPHAVDRRLPPQAPSRSPRAGQADH